MAQISTERTMSETLVPFTTWQQGEGWGNFYVLIVLVFIEGQE